MRQPATETSRPKSTRAAGSKKPSRSKSVAWKKYTSAHKFQLAPHPPPAASNQPLGRIRVFSSSIQNWTLFSCHPHPFLWRDLPAEGMSITYPTHGDDIPSPPSIGDVHNHTPTGSDLRMHASAYKFDSTRRCPPAKKIVITIYMYIHSNYINHYIYLTL